MPISQKRPTPERDSDSQDERDNYSSMKKAKKGNNDKSSSLEVSSAGGGRRVWWCHEDEITVLEGMIEYKNKEGAYPPNDMVALHDFIKWKLLSDMSRTQMYEKVKRLKKKFLINLERVEDSVEPFFSKPHDYVLFSLSRKIWGDVNTNSRSRRAKSTDDNDDDRRKRDNVKRKKNIKSRKQPVIKGYNGSSCFIKEVKKDEVTMDDDSEGDFQSKYPFLSEALCEMSSSFVLVDSVKRLLKEKLSSIGSAKAKELEKKWTKIREQEREILLQKMHLIALQTELMLKGSKNR